MSFSRFSPTPSPENPPVRGAAAVGMLHELPLAERSAILLLRQWCGDDRDRAEMARDFAGIFGPAQGARNVALLGHLVSLLAHHGRRPLAQHDVACPCFGGDESAFAQMIAAATAGDRDDAMALGLTLMPPAVAFAAVHAAEQVGLFILRLAPALARAEGRCPTSSTTH